MMKKSEEKQSFIIGMQYDTIRDILIKKVQKSLEGKKLNYKVKYTCSIIAIFISYLLNKGNLDCVMANNDMPEENVEIEQEETIDLCQTNQDIAIGNIIEETENLVEVNNQIVEENCNQNLYDSYLQEYSNYYHLNSEKVIELAKITTNNYEDFFKIIGREDYDYTNPEACCMLFVYYLNRNELTIDLCDFNLTKEDLVTTKEIETIPHNNIAELYLSNGQKYSEFYLKVCDLFNINHKELSLASSIFEISENGSFSSNTRNNFGGMKNKSGEFMTFPTPEAGIISMCGNYKSKFDTFSIENIEELAGYYVTGNKTKKTAETKRWAESVNYFYCNICENYEEYFSSDDYEYAMNLSLTK